VPHQEAAVSVIRTMSLNIDSAIASPQPPQMVSMIPCRPQTWAQRIFARIPSIVVVGVL